MFLKESFGMALNIIGLSGSACRPSLATSLIRQIMGGIETAIDCSARLIELADEAPQMLSASTPGRRLDPSAQLIRAAEEADLLIVAAPVDRGSLNGSTKYLLNLVDRRAFAGKPVILVAIGSTPLHRLVNEQQFLPLFRFLNAPSLPTAIYATEQDFIEGCLVNAQICAQVDHAVSEAAAHLRIRGNGNAGTYVPARAAANKLG